MKISFLLPHLGIYGGIRRVIELSNVLITMGHKVTVFHSDGSPCTWMELRAQVQPMSEAFKTSHDNLIYLAYEQRRDVSQMDINHLYCYSCNLYNVRLLRLPSAILAVGKNYSHQLNKAFHIKKALLDPNAQILANCTSIKNDIKKYVGRKADVVFGGVNRNFFYPIDVPHDPQRPRILFLGSKKPWKGMDVVQQAVDIVRKEISHIELMSFFGKGIPQDKMAEVYNSADVFIDAQYYAGWNNPIAEAMACKVPVVCGDIEPNKDIALNNETAIVVPVNSPKKYAEAILKLIKDKELRDHLVDNAYKKIAEFTWEKSANKLINILVNQPN